ncbi:hypothetical protein LWC35_34105 [Pseudonocardia kujensis]|uniref:hypothetical protein n=1 Tax=Pseudonocardia kujensis TaxID=1128675 RepID=UPI001E34FC42|nr:hypothetical protein [Pseudonocardia kujensis]MCE0767898.1 hypothetical protein [Pseudonocardia kujensis]
MTRDDDPRPERVRALHDTKTEERSPAAPPGSGPDDQAQGVEPMAEVPGGPQVDVPAAQGHMPASTDDETAERGRD